MFRFFTLLFLLLTGFQCFAQSGGVKGYVKDGTSGNEIDNVNIVLKPGYYATTTNADGYFSINRVPPGNYTLSASMVGYDSMSVKIIILADKTINQIVYLEPFVFNVGGGKV